MNYKLNDISSKLIRESDLHRELEDEVTEGINRGVIH